AGWVQGEGPLHPARAKQCRGVAAPGDRGRKAVPARPGRAVVLRREGEVSPRGNGPHGGPYANDVCKDVTMRHRRDAAILFVSGLCLLAVTPAAFGVVAAEAKLS